MSPASEKKPVAKKAASKKAAKKKADRKKAAKKKVTGDKAATKKTASKKAVKKKTVKKKAVEAKPAVKVTPEERYNMIAVVAYLKAERRGFAPGNELQDWAEAEKEVDEQLQG